MGRIDAYLNACAAAVNDYELIAAAERYGRHSRLFAGLNAHRPEPTRAHAAMALRQFIRPRRCPYCDARRRIVGDHLDRVHPVEDRAMQIVTRGPCAICGDESDRCTFARTCSCWTRGISCQPAEIRLLNVAHYWRPSHRHQWRNIGTTVNVTDTADNPAPVRCWTEAHDPGYQYADIPYDWEAWRPPRRARTLPGLTQAMLDMLPR